MGTGRPGAKGKGYAVSRISSIEGGHPRVRIRTVDPDALRLALDIAVSRARDVAKASGESNATPSEPSDSTPAIGPGRRV